MQSVSCFGILFFAGFMVGALGAEVAQTTIASAAANQSTSAEANTEVPKSNSSVPDQKAVDPTRPPPSDVPTTTPALVHVVSSTTTSKPNATMPSNAPNKTLGSAPVSTKKDGKGNGSSALHAGLAVVSVVVLLISGTFS